MKTFKRLTRWPDIEKFKELFSAKIKYEVPIYYISKGECYGFFKDGELVGGFCLVHDIPWKLRSIQQIPSGDGISKYLEKAGLTLTNVAEFTGYFINDKKYGIFFTYHLVKTIFRHKAKRFVYSYPVSQKRLERYYSKGTPVRLYSGKPKYLPGHDRNMEDEHVEVLTKWGIFKIFLSRTLRYLFR